MRKNVSKKSGMRRIGGARRFAAAGAALALLTCSTLRADEVELVQLATKTYIDLAAVKLAITPEAAAEYSSKKFVWFVSASSDYDVLDGRPICVWSSQIWIINKDDVRSSTKEFEGYAYSIEIRDSKTSMDLAAKTIGDCDEAAQHGVEQMAAKLR